jgi:hypothetical protein
MKTALILSYYVCALLGIFGCGAAGLFVATFALDSPSISDARALMVGGTVFAGLALPLVVLPILAARQIRKGTSLVLPFLYALVTLFLLPVGLVQAFIAWRLRRQERASSGADGSAADG